MGNKQEFEVPVYADIIKTGIHKNNSPYDDDWFYVRAAAVARQVYIHRGIGVGALRRHFGGAQRRGTRRQFCKRIWRFNPKYSTTIRKFGICRSRRTGRKN